jgi:hypothetical protein
MKILGKSNNRKHTSHEHCLLMLEIPRTNDKKELAAEQMLASLHGILKSKKEIRFSGTLQEHISLEVAAIGQTNTLLYVDAKTAAGIRGRPDICPVPYSPNL